ncbi:hypothetical protein OUZ56_012578 [Daphnia magna]|uniref:Uncharacterized protein n=1 Tax=Daphnia magna TaxID=35525 RepID=A0ABQ9Z3I2_9CRUS|nr:hypothetical protein OUZ56_012578 [Daphnia magna]
MCHDMKTYYKPAHLIFYKASQDMYCPTMHSQEVHSQPLYDASQMSLNSSVLCLPSNRFGCLSTITHFSDVDISRITTSTEHDAADHNSKGDGERLDNPSPPLTIPSNGPLPWHFNDILVQAIEINTLAHHESRFTRACGRHLLKLRPEKRTKSEYKIYSKIIVDRFPYFEHEFSKDGNWVVFKP